MFGLCTEYDRNMSFPTLYRFQFPILADLLKALGCKVGNARINVLCQDASESLHFGQTPFSLLAFYRRGTKDRGADNLVRKINGKLS